MDRISHRAAVEAGYAPLDAYVREYEGKRPYISPIRAKDVERRRGSDGKLVMVRTHYYPQADGSQHPCQPHSCRECYREKHWKEGQSRA